MEKHPLDTPRHEAICAWLTANGISPNDIPIDADLTIGTEPDDTRTIRYEAFVYNAEGRKVLDERCKDVAIEKRTTPLIVEPPAWWAPHAKPTRDDLLATLKRVRALPDHPEVEDAANPWSADHKAGYRHAMQIVRRAIGKPPTVDAPAPKERS